MFKSYLEYWQNKSDFFPSYMLSIHLKCNQFTTIHTNTKLCNCESGNCYCVFRLDQDSTYRFHAIPKPALSIRIW